jgi:hypothetical protein
MIWRTRSAHFHRAPANPHHGSAHPFSAQAGFVAESNFGGVAVIPRCSHSRQGRGEVERQKDDSIDFRRRKRKPFATFGDVVDSVANAGRVIALIDIFERLTPVEFEPKQLTPVA